MYNLISVDITRIRSQFFGVCRDIDFHFLWNWIEYDCTDNFPPLLQNQRKIVKAKGKSSKPKENHKNQRKIVKTKGNCQNERKIVKTKGKLSKQKENRQNQRKIVKIKRKSSKPKENRQNQRKIVKTIGKLSKSKGNHQNQRKIVKTKVKSSKPKENHQNQRKIVKTKRKLYSAASKATRKIVIQFGRKWISISLRLCLLVSYFHTQIKIVITVLKYRQHSQARLYKVTTLCIST